MYGMVFYNTPADTISGLRNRMSVCFLLPMLSVLMPYVSICIYTSDKRIYLADVSAKLYRPWAYYASKVRGGTGKQAPIYARSQCLEGSCNVSPATCHDGTAGFAITSICTH
jgi:hypothetical protein